MQDKKRKADAMAGGTDHFARRQRLLQERQALPMWSARDQLLQLIKSHHTLIVVGETGSGKTTQIPQFLHEAGLLSGGGMIGVTQPRRVAAMTVARRVADEMGVKLGQQVGYSIRFDDATSPSTVIKYMTDGMLLREALLDPMLKKYKVIIVDEAHERTVHTDVLLGLLKGVKARRKDSFKLLVMSATLEARQFADYFGGARCAYVQGRTYPVSVLYTTQPEENYLDAALCAVLQVHVDEPSGDILVFLTGQDEIDSLERLLHERVSTLPDGLTDLQLIITPMYAALPPEQQMKVFDPAPAGARKAILATNIAETSITIPGVKYVIDTGFVKARGYNAKLGADSLQVVPVSQAQARQRSGRAGREAPGKAYRLYTEDAFSALAAATPPEILRSNLSSVVLQLKALGVNNVVEFDFMDPPPKAAIVRSLELLYALGALDTSGNLTNPSGVQLARLPVDPMYGKVLLASATMGCSVEAMQVVAMVSTENVFFNPRNKQEQVSSVRSKFLHAEGDHFTLLAVMRGYLETPRKQQATWCSENFINIRALRKAFDIYQQLEQHLKSLQLPLKSCANDPIPLQRTLVSGLFPHAAKRQADGSYKVIATGQLVHVHPSSVLCRKRPECIVFNELVRTTKQYARDVCRIQPRWLPELAPAFFAAKAGAAIAVEQQR
eukprot:jgi/Chrzof1/9508/Cz04g05220.t1